MSTEMIHLEHVSVAPKTQIGVRKNGQPIYLVAGGAIYNPTGSGQVHIDKVLTNISIGWVNEGLVGPALFPAVQVQKQSDLYYVFGREGWLPEDDYRAPGTEATEIPGLAVSTEPYYAKEHALQIAVTDEERENADSPLSPDRDGTEMLTSKVMLSRELVIHDYATNAANYNADLTVDLSASTYAQSWDKTAADPIKQIHKAQRDGHAKLFMSYNTAILPYEVMSILEDNADLIERIKYSERAILTPELVATLLGLSNVIVPGAGFNSSGNAGATENIEYIWGTDVILAYVPGRPGLKIPAYGYEFAWMFSGTGAQAVDRWREERRASDILRLRRRYDLKMTALDEDGLQVAGYLFKNAVDPAAL
jgi:hypothetical protein